MNERNLKRLEFDKVKEQLKAHASSELAGEMIEGLVPLTTREEVEQALAEVSEGRDLLRLEPAARLDGWHDIRKQVRLCARGGVLEPRELWQVAETLKVTRLVKSFFNERLHKYPLLGGIAAGLGYFRQIEKQITAAVLPEGEISDRATDRLYSIRRKLVAARQRVRDRLDEVVRSPVYQKYLQDAIVTIRDGRYVVPVKQEYRAQVAGIVHDQSASGATLFIEPASVVEANNEVRSLQAEEKQEIDRILQRLSAAVGGVAEELLCSLQILGRLDFIMTKARYSERLDAWAPCVTGEPKLSIRQGRHPLLAGRAVPVDVHLGETFDTLVITGPNTGGKTVLLKTVGLMVVMARAGLHVPAGEGTVIGMFDDIFVDIGDEQSIEQSLSTFSSHLSNIVDILSRAGSNSLVLLDELGAGTDPAEGSALARAILDQLRRVGAKTMATTHYGELKEYAYASKGVENASVEFDPETLQPTYKLLIGRPGRSNAFEIARRLGLGEDVLQKAREYLTEEQVQVGDLIAELEKARLQAQKEQAEIERLRREAKEYCEQYHALLEQVRSRKDAIISQAVMESRDLIKRAKRETERLLDDLRRQLKEKSLHERELYLHRARKQLGEMRDQLEEKLPADTAQAPHDTEPLTAVNAGEEIFIPRYGQHGVVLEAPDREGNVLVQVGMIKMNINLRELRRPVSCRSEQRNVGLGRLVQKKARNVPTRLDLRGLRVEEALAEVEKYLDDACLAGLSVVYLVHGKGTGALRSAVQQMLKEHRYVKTFRLGEQGEGGSGVTVVELS